MDDKILRMFFEPTRWPYAIERGIFKGINKAELYKLTRPKVRASMYQAIRDGKYNIAPPHTAHIPKDDGTFRTVYINEPIDRVFLSLANDLLFELTSSMIHPSCQSYQKGIGCGKIVKDVASRIAGANGKIVGWKADLSKYFDSVPLLFIDAAFDAVEKKHGHSAIIDVLREYYHSDWYFDVNNDLCSAYQSLKQGCAVASWLANVVLYHIDEKLSQLDGEYVRYSDDILFVGPDYEKAMGILEEELSKMGMKLNPKKVEYLSDNKWFKFLGYSIRGNAISLSYSRLKTFQSEIMKRTVADRKTTPKKALNSVFRYLYKGNGEYSWATQILPVCNVDRDILELDKFVMDCLRAVTTSKNKVGGLGYMAINPDGCIVRGIGRNVRANRDKLPEIEGYITISAMRNALITNREAYKTLVENL